MSLHPTLIYSFLGLTALSLSGCGGGTSTPLSASSTEITLERGPVLKALLMDAKGQRATEIANGRYAFANAPTYPLTSYGGYIDMDRDGSVNTGDLAMNQLRLMVNDGEATTLVSTLALQPDNLAYFLTDLDLTQDDINNLTPSEDKTIAAISDEVFQYLIVNPDILVTDLVLDDTLKAAIETRISDYLARTETAAELEQALVDALETNGDLTTLDETQATEANAEKSPAQQILASYPVYPVSEEIKAAMAYLWNEEKLARDLYMTLYELHNFTLRPLYNISTKAETEHVESMTAVLEKYNVSPDYYLDAANDGENAVANSGFNQDTIDAIQDDTFVNPEITDLYNTLLSQGTPTEVAALQVGCAVEVTDVADLNDDIALVEEVGAEDLVKIYENLRQGSYNHYWAFDKRLINLGVTDGCGSLGEAYDKTPEEFPQQKG